MSTRQYLTICDYERRAKEILKPGDFCYFSSGANEERTLRDNQDAWKRFRLRPRMLRGVGERTLKTEVLGECISMPICIAPNSFHILADREAECATARAAQSCEVVYTMSVAANKTPKEVVTSLTTDSQPRWYQLYIFKDRRLTLDIIQQIEKLNFKALVVTIDLPVTGQRIANDREPLQLPSYFKIPMVTQDRALDSYGSTSNFYKSVGSIYDSNLTWDDIRWLSNQTRLPVIAKGIMSGQDAILAVNSGCKAVWVSNHGARQLDNEPATADVLKEVVHSLSSCSSSCEIYVDGGIRNGTDVLTALALGAHAVFIGRPILYGLACRGQQGVEHVLQLLRKEFDTAMALCGVKTVQECRDGSLVIHEKQLPSRL